MNNIITLRRLSELIANEANVDPAQAEQFIKTLTTEIGGALVNKDTVKLRDIGEFSIEENKIVFVPTPELANTINEPFAMFSPEELDADVTAEQLRNSAKIMAETSSELQSTVPDEVDSENNDNNKTIVEKTEILESKENVTNPVTEEHGEQTAEHPQVVEEEPLTMTKKPMPSVTIEPFDDEDDEEEIDNNNNIQYQSSESGFPTFWVSWGVAFGLIIGLAIGFFVHDPIERMLEPSLDENYAEEELYDEIEGLPEASLNAEEEIAEKTPENNEEPSKPEESEVASQIASQPEQPVAVASTPAATPQEDVYDTIREGNSLGTMARKHYGANVYWVYIYLENQSKISNPNRVAIGTTLKIPPLSKYATKATDAENKADAQKKVSEILKKYPN